MKYNSNSYGQIYGDQFNKNFSIKYEVFKLHVTNQNP